MKQETIYSDFTVIGGGLSGIAAAVSAARLGLKVSLVQNRPMLGGNHSSECRVHMNGAAERGYTYYAREAGIADEIKQRILHFNPRYNKKEDYDLTDMALLEMVLEEANISLFLNTTAEEVKVKDNTIQEIEAYNSVTEIKYRFISPLFADASGNGCIGFQSGALFRTGREARKEYKETFAPKIADEGKMGSCILFTVAKADKPVPFVKPPFAYDYQKDDILKWTQRPELGRKLPEKLDGVDGIWWLSYGGKLDTVRDMKEIDMELKKLVYGFWDYVKNSGAYQNTENYYISWIAPFPAIRESRRFRGDHVLTEKDLLGVEKFEDGISTGGWSIDIHDPAGIYGKDKASQFGEVDALYEIPYRILYSVNISNLFFCGRIVSTTHVALGSVRVMETLAAMAHSVGTAASLCKKYGIMPRQIYTDGHILELQNQLQRDGQYLLGKTENLGIAMEADVTASSEIACENIGESQLEYLTEEIAFVVPVDKNGCLEECKIRLKNSSQKQTSLQVEAYEGKDVGVYLPGRRVWKGTISLKETSDEWVTIRPMLNSIENGHIFIVLKKDENLQIYCTKEAPVGMPSFIWNNGRVKRFADKVEPHIRSYKYISFKDVLPKQKIYEGKNIVNGFARPYLMPNLWMSYFHTNNWISLKLKKSQDIKEIQILFNGELEKDYFNQPIQSLIKDYDVILISDQTQQIIPVRNNYLTLNRFYGCYKNIKEILFKFYSTYGSKFISVYSVKLFSSNNIDHAKDLNNCH